MRSATVITHPAFAKKASGPDDGHPLGSLPLERLATLPRARLAKITNWILWEIEEWEGLEPAIVQGEGAQ